MLKTVELPDRRTGRTIELRVVQNGVATERAEPLDSNRPEWIRASAPSGPNYERLRAMTRRLSLYTVCQEAHCPNVAECWAHGTMTIMLLGGVCTRACRFCAVDTGNPQGWLDPEEPRHVGEAIAELKLSYVVLTSVNRDDLPDGGASQFAETIRTIKRLDPNVKVEALTPDFLGNERAVDIVLDSGVDVFAHNIETVRRLTPSVRDPRANYDQSLAVLNYAKHNVLTKSSLMLGLGETDDEILEAMADLRAANVDIFTMGQYLRPTRSHLPVVRYVPPSDFDRYAASGKAAGFLEVFSGPLVRSSYRAERVFAVATHGIT